MTLRPHEQERRFAAQWSTDAMTGEPDYEADTILPVGKTCDDCRHSPRCFSFGFSEPGAEQCDFWPRKFAERQTP